MSSPAESALEVLRQSQSAREMEAQTQAELGQRMLRVLRERGELLFGKWGLYGGTDGVIGSAERGQRVTQSTLPVPIGIGTLVALRHPLQNEPTTQGLVELVQTTQWGAEYCMQVKEKTGRIHPDNIGRVDPMDYIFSDLETDIIATAFSRSTRFVSSKTQPDFVRMHKSGTEPTADEALALNALLDHIETEIEPIDESWLRADLPKIRTYLPVNELYGVHSIRDMPEMPWQLQP